MYTCEHTYVGAEVDLKCHSSGTDHLVFWSQGLTLEPRAHQLGGYWGSQSGPFTDMASVLLTGLFPAPRVICIFQIVYCPVVFALLGS